MNNLELFKDPMRGDSISLNGQRLDGVISYSLNVSASDYTTMNLELVIDTVSTIVAPMQKIEEITTRSITVEKTVEKREISRTDLLDIEE